MKKNNVVSVLTILISLSIGSCQKDISKKTMDVTLKSKIIVWLNNQKPADNLSKTATINLLMDNLDYSNLHYEKHSKDDQFIVIPIRENFKKLKNVDERKILTLLLVISNAGNIIRGNIAMYIPDSATKENNIPVNTFANLYNNKPNSVNGIIRFLSVTGNRLYEWRIKNGKPVSLGVVKTKTDI